VAEINQQESPRLPKKLGFAIPKLNVTGLGLSEIIPDNLSKGDNIKELI
jgi:hypothetical protein